MYWFLYNSNGVITESHQNSTLQWENLNGNAGAVSFADSDATAQAAFVSPIQYTVQNGQLNHSNAPTQAEQLASAQQAQIAKLHQSFDAALEQGFPSSATSTKDTYAIDPISMGKWTGTLALINSGSLTTDIQVKDIGGNKVTLTTAQFKTFAMDGFTYYHTQEQNLWTKEDDVKNATTVSAVQAATY